MRVNSKEIASELLELTFGICEKTDHKGLRQQHTTTIKAE